MLEFKEFVPTVPLDTTLTATQEDAFANLDSRTSEDSVNLSAEVTKPTLTVNAFATMVFHCIMESALATTLAH
jgi:hypothetical protein